MPATCSAQLMLARIRIGEVGIGIRIEAVLQALPLPETLGRLPLRTHALLGMVEHEGVAVPVVDLARWLDVGAAPADAAPQLLLLRDGDRTVGLRVDALDELVEVEAAALQRLHHGDNPDDVFHSAVPAGNGVLLSLLEVARLADLALCWSMAPTAAAPAAPLATETLQRTCYALLDTGHGLIGVPPAVLAEVLALPALTHIGSSAWCDWHGRQLALVSSAALFHASGVDTRVESAPLLAVLQHAGLALGVPVQAVLRLDDFGPGLSSTDGIGENVIDANGAAVLLVDVARLLARHPEAALASGDSVAPTLSASAGAGARVSVSVSNTEAYIVFDAAGLQALPLGAIEQIVPLAAPLGPTMAWHGAAIPLLDLRADAPGEDGAVLVARGAHGLAGHIVRRVQSLIPAGAGRMFRMGASRAEFIMTDDGGQEATYRIATLGVPQPAS
ncbi:chemotaxis signal transduction protein [Massilia sp. MP_M2]|uniref:chemotaxis protein CheW n=1 Tax=Massilia sp. MP_M2 TaxID=3071713 RepID=UPI00319E536A